MTSFVWKLFKINDPSESIAICIPCGKQISRGSNNSGQKSFSTTPLHNHAKKFHLKLYEEERENNIEPSASSIPQERSKGSMLILKKMCEMKKQMSIEDSISSKKIWDINNEKSKQIHKKKAMMIALDNQPFSITEDDGFIGLMAHLQPRYLIPSRHFFSENALPQLYDDIKKKVFNEITKAQSISFTSDIWTCSSSNETFISLSGHWIKNTFERKHAVLYASHFPESHTGINIAGKFINMLESWEINSKRRHLLVKDGAANMSLGSKLAQITSVHCTIHLLQLVIKDAVLSQRLVIDLLAKARRIAGHFNHSSKACTEFKLLQQQQNETPLLLVHDVPTRWNSAYLMLERLQKLKRAVQIYLADHNELPTFTSNDWKFIESLLHILKPFYELTKFMSSDVCSLSTVVPNICTLQRFLSKVDQKDDTVQITKHLLASLNKRFFSQDNLDITNDERYVLSTIIDPRYKLKFLPIDKREQARSMLLEAVVKNQRNKNELSPEVINIATCSNNLTPSAKKKKVDLTENDFDSCFLELAEYEGNGENDGHINSDQVSLVQVAQEVDVFFNQSIIDKNNDALNYWKYEEKFPLLKDLALKLLAPPASSVFSERLFSEYGNIYEKKRSRLLPQRGEMLLFIHNANKFTNE